MAEKIYGRKIFIIYPNDFIRNEIVFPLIDKEYEIYLVDNHKSIPLIEKRFRESLYFINIDEVMNISQWENQISHYSRFDLTGNSGIGILSYNINKNIAFKFDKMKEVTCGYHSLRQKSSEIIGNIVPILEQFRINENRKYIRTSLEGDKNRFKLSLSGLERTGYINDISSVGMTLVFDKLIKIEKNTLINNIHLSIKESGLTVSGVFLGARRVDSGKIIYVIIFDKSVKSSTRSRLRIIINRILQERFLI